MATVLAAALGYALLGLPVFPVHGIRRPGLCTCADPACGRNAGKHPLTKHGLKDASTEDPVIRRWWQRWPLANVAIRTGPESETVVIDVDPRHGGTLDAAAALCGGALPPTWLTRTGSGGWHIWFRYPSGMKITNRGGLRDGIDVRAAGGYVVGPPSPHYSGGVYQWEVDPANDLAPMPEPLIAALRQERSRPLADLAKLDLAKLEHSIAGIVDVLLRARDGERNNLLYWCACRLGEMVKAGRIGSALAEGLLSEAARRIGLAGPEVPNTIESGMREGRGG
jgi:hypothetical protein